MTLVSAQQEAEDELLTIDEIAAATGVTTRTTRYYMSLGLLPAPIRRGRVAYYTAEHRARLVLIRALQDHGFTLAAVEGYLRRLPKDATPEDLAVQRAMLAPWSLDAREELTRRQLDGRAGRRLSDDDLERLVRTGAVERRDNGKLVPLPPFRVGVELLDLDVPESTISAAGEAIGSHMDQLVDELTRIMREDVIDPYRQSRRTEEDAARFERTVAKLRQLVLESIVTGFQRAANQLITGSLERD